MAEAPVRPASVADFTFKLGDKGTEDLKVTGFTGTEEISRLFSFRVTLCSDEADIAFDETVGKPCVLEIASASGTRFVNGIVRRFERSGDGSALTYYTAEVVPVHWLLTQRHKSRIFQQHNCPDMTIPGIVKRVFEDAGIPEDAYRFALQATYDTREYVVQYRESEMNFIARLMEEEGIFFFFEHGAEGHVMVIGDGPTAHTATPSESEFVFRSPTGLVTESEQEYVYEIRDGQEVRTGAIRLDDYDFQQPQLDLMVTTAADRFTSLEYSDHPGEYGDKAVGDRYATTRLQEFQCQRRVEQMSATVRALLPGYTFTLKEHATDSLNRDYLVTAITHEARQPQSAQEEAGAERGTEYRADVWTIPADVPFRPPRVAPRPLIHGTQTAIVVGPSGEEIYTDKYGRVKVQFHWDCEGTYDENSSRWIRVSHGLAGGQYGMTFLPRVGQEVVVEYLEGDPDRPLITGRVYNNDQMPPYTLPDEKTKSAIKTHSSKGGGGTNEIRFEDLKDSEQILLYAQKDLHIRVNNDRVENVDNDRHLTVKKSKNELVGGDRSLSVGGNLKEKIKADVSTKIDGKESKKVAGTFSLTCDSDVVETFKANHKHDVTATYAAKAQSIKLEASTGIEIKVGGNSIILSASGIALKAGGSSVVLTPAAVFIKGGPAVQINTAPGPPGMPVGPVVASATQPEDPEAPLDADTAVPGRDTTYNKAALEYEAVEVEVLPAKEVPSEPVAPPELTWIEIELIDEADQPCAGERYELKLPDGKIRRGTLDANGLARAINIPPGECQICFPRLDAEAWERI